MKDSAPKVAPFGKEPAVEDAGKLWPGAKVMTPLGAMESPVAAGKWVPEL
jgi:hypothetical protein